MDLVLLEDQLRCEGNDIESAEEKYRRRQDLQEFVLDERTQFAE